MSHTYIHNTHKHSIAAELALPATHFSHEEGSEMREFDIAVAGDMVSEVVRHAKHVDFYKAASDALGRWLSRETRRRKQGHEGPLSRLFDGVSDLCSFVCCAYKFSADEKNLVQHIALTSSLLPKVLFPLIQGLGKMELGAVNPALSLDLSDVVPAMYAVLDVLTLATFCPTPQATDALRKQNVLVSWLRDLPLLRLRAGINMTVRILNINVNMDSLTVDGEEVGEEGGEDGEDAPVVILRALEELCDKMTGDTRDALLKAFEGGSTPFPVSREHATFGLVQDLLRSTCRAEQSATRTASGAGADNQAANTAAGPRAPIDFLCELNGHLMKDPVATPAGHVYERSTVLAWIGSHGTDPKEVGAALKPEDLRTPPGLSNRIMKWHISESMKVQKKYDNTSIYDF
jgi:hypothetical protein